MSRLKERYLNELRIKLSEEFGIKNLLAVPAIKKIVINVGMGDLRDNQATLEKVLQDIAALSGQKPVVTKARKSISTFKLSKGQPIGAMVTLRGNRMYDFLDKLMTIVLPKVRDFRGVSNASFDMSGNFSLGLREQGIFPEVSFHGSISSGKIKGLEISIVTSAKNKEQGRRLLELLGMPFRKS